MINKTALLISNGHSHLINELPRILKNGGYRVTVISPPYWTLNRCSCIDEFIQAPSDPNRVLEQAAKIVQDRKFDLTILGTDELNWALLNHPMEPSIKALLSPIANPHYWSALGGKIGVSTLCKDLNILTPPSKIVHSQPEALLASSELGFPVMLKIPKSYGGNGVFKCHSPQEVIESAISQNSPILIEKFLEGDLISVEPLFLQSRLIGYSTSIVTFTPTPFSPSLERLFIPFPEIEPILQKLGTALQISGFFNLSFIRESSSQKLYLFEFDFRPNCWVRSGELAGVNWSHALAISSSYIQRVQWRKSLRIFPADLYYAIKTKNLSRIFYWIFNRNNSWKAIPFHEPQILCVGLWRLIRKALF